MELTLAEAAWDATREKTYAREAFSRLMRAGDANPDDVDRGLVLAWYGETSSAEAEAMLESLREARRAAAGRDRDPFGEDIALKMAAPPRSRESRRLMRESASRDAVTVDPRTAANVVIRECNRIAGMALHRELGEDDYVPGIRTLDGMVARARKMQEARVSGTRLLRESATNPAEPDEKTRALQVMREGGIPLKGVRPAPSNGPTDVVSVMREFGIPVKGDLDAACRPLREAARVSTVVDTVEVDAVSARTLMRKLGIPVKRGRLREMADRGLTTSATNHPADTPVVSKRSPLAYCPDCTDGKMDDGSTCGTCDGSGLIRVMGAAANSGDTA